MGIEVMWIGNCFSLHYLSFDSLRQDFFEIPGRGTCKVSILAREGSALSSLPLGLVLPALPNEKLIVD